MSLSDKLRRAMTVAAQDESLESLGRKWKVSPPVLGRFLKGERGLNLDTAERIATGLGLHLASEKEAVGFEMSMGREEERISRERLIRMAERLDAMARNLVEMSKEIRHDLSQNASGHGQ